MSNLTRFLVVSLIFTLALRADSSIENARRAQSLLDPSTWSELIRIENVGRQSRYPRVVHALVFEFAGILWFYTDTDGTQSFSLHQNRLAEEKADFAPLLRDIDPGFKRWEVVSGVSAAGRPDRSPLRNGCFVESVAELHERRMRGLPVVAPRLLSYYAEVEGQRHGHTVLAYETGGRLEVFDPARRTKALSFPASYGINALNLAQTLAGARVSKARYTTVPQVAAPITVATSGRGAQAGEIM